MTFRAITAIALIVAAPAMAQVNQGPPNVPGNTPAFENQTRAPEIEDAGTLRTETVADGLVHPWGVEPLPGGGYLVTERVGRLQHVAADGTMTEVQGVPEVVARRQGGLLDVALVPDFETSREIYLTYSKPQGSGDAATAVASARLSDDAASLEEVSDLYVQTPPSPTAMHFGSRVVPDGDVLYVTLGEHSSEAERVLAQDLGASYGKVVRIAPDGSVPEDNPFAEEEEALPEVWTYGHRNPQGAALGPEGRLWVLEHGPAGGDELNLVEPGANYGWPDVSYGQKYSGAPVGSGETSAEGVTEPVYYWDPVIAPGGFTFYEGDMFEGWDGDVVASSLTPGGIVRLNLEDDRVTGEARYLPELGRVRDIDIDADGALLVLTDDPDGALIRVLPGEGA